MAGLKEYWSMTEGAFNCLYPRKRGKGIVGSPAVLRRVFSVSSVLSVADRIGFSSLTTGNMQ